MGVTRKFLVRVDDKEKNVEVSKSNGVYEIQMDGRQFSVDCRYFGASDHLSLLIENKSYLVESGPQDASTGRYFARVMGRHYDLDVLDELLMAVRDAEAAEEHHGRHVVTAPMPGLVVDVKVKPGDTVALGGPVVVMEAMKMQNELASNVEGVVKEVMIAVGDTVDSQTPLVIIEQNP